ncbi:MAG TPA: hypothetical protein VN641_14075 [Urbifossiella sp.]|nr:hypothetical protein [Urbifossiella sp.]
MRIADWLLGKGDAREAEIESLRRMLAQRDSQLREAVEREGAAEAQLRIAAESKAALEANLQTATDATHRAAAANRQETDRIRELYRLRLGGSPLASDDATGWKPDDRIALHVGFGHAATTSLQALFASRADIFYRGLPYTSAGGFFSFLKYQDDYRLNVEFMLKLCREEVYEHPERGGRPVVVSDETFTETAEVYYAPRQLPDDAIAARLMRYFPNARVLFTIRNQLEYVESMYFNLKRNCAFLAGMPLPPFEEWWAGLQTQVQCWYVRNVDYFPLIDHYASLFGRENVLVLPLEELQEHGSSAYLGRLFRFMDLPLSEADLQQFNRPRNVRMSAVEERAAELLANRSAAPILRQALENPALAGLLPQSPRAELHIGEGVAEEIRGRARAGNRRLAEQFHLPLEVYGYPL